MCVLTACFQAAFQNRKCGGKMKDTAGSLVISSVNMHTQLDSVAVWKAEMINVHSVPWASETRAVAGACHQSTKNLQENSKEHSLPA